ncbi:MAG: ASKHA domain-containing protein [Candidatus Sumerlaeaceae bacterium]
MVKLSNSVKLKVQGVLSVSKTVPSGLPLTEALAACGVLVNQPCGGRGTCGKCRVRFLSQPPQPTAEETALLGSEALAQGWRLSCRHQLCHDAVVENVADSPLGVWKDFGPPEPIPIAEQRWQKMPITLDKRENDERESASVEEVIWHAATGSSARILEFSMRARRELSQHIADRTKNVDLLVCDECHVASARFPGLSSHYAVAFDVGTTTLAAALLDLLDGCIVKSVTELNPQVRFGGDVISRIAYSVEHGCLPLRQVLTKALEQMTLQLCKAAEISPSQIVAGALVGNSFMLHSLLGVNPYSLGQAPYRPLWREPLELLGSEIGLPALAEALVFVPPLLGNHVGADAAAAIVATQLDVGEAPRLLVDLGTNCEVVLSVKGSLLVTSAAAGPAFEGGNITHGMRATRGAIDRAALTAAGDLWIHTIGNSQPLGICGAGLVHLVDLLVSLGVIDQTGRLLWREELPEPVASWPLAERIVCSPSGEQAFVVADPPHGKTITLTASDVRQLQLVKGSIRAAIEILLKEAELSADQLQTIFVTGLLGCHLKKSSLLRLGLLPLVKPGKIELLGNAAAFGCRQVLVDKSAWKRACALPSSARHVELAEHADYADRFAQMMAFSPA